MDDEFFACLPSPPAICDGDLPCISSVLLTGVEEAPPVAKSSKVMVRAEPVSKLETRRATHTPEGVALFASHDIRGTEEGLPSIAGVILCSEAQPFINMVFVTQKGAKMERFSSARPSDVSLPVHAGAGVPDFRVRVTARTLPAADMPYCFRKGFDLAPYKQAWELLTPVNVRCKVQGRVYLPGDPIEAFNSPHAEFAFGHSMPVPRTLLNSPPKVTKKMKSEEPPTAATSKRRRATPLLPIETVIDFSQPSVGQ